MRRGIAVPLVLLVAAAPVAGAQEGAATVDPGMTKSQVIERLGPPAAERSRGSYTYLFYQNGCERTCGMSDLVTLESDTVVDAIFRAPYRQYAGISSSPSPRRPDLVRRGSAPLSLPSAHSPGPASASMAEEFAALLGEAGAVSSAEPAAASPAVTSSPPVRQASASSAPSSVSREIAELLGAPLPPEEPEPTVEPRPAQPARGTARPVLSSEVAELLGLPAPPAGAAEPEVTGSTTSASVLSPEIADLLRDPAADSAKPTPDAAATAKPVQDLPRADTIKTSGRAGAASTWPPPRAKTATDSAPARPSADSTKQQDKPKNRTRPTWPPPAR